MKTASLLALAVAVALGGCGGTSPGASTNAPAQTARSTTSTSAAGHPAAPAALHVRVVARGTLPAPVQLPAVVATGGGTVLALGGLSSADASVSDVVRLAPGTPRVVGHLPVAAHDLGVAALQSKAYAFGGGTASGPIDTVTTVTPSGAAHVSGHLPVAMSDTSAATIGDTAYVIGGYTTTTPLRSVLAIRPGHATRDVATLPHPLRYAAVAAIGGRLLIAGGTDGSNARREVLSVDPVAHRVKVIAHLSAALGHAAGAVLGGQFLILGGRGDGLTSQRATIWAVDPGTGRLRRAGRLPVALSDLGAVTASSDGVLVAGGRDATGRVYDELWTLGAR
ncbi:MAG: hypothetical protein QOC54_2150 [Baekduia sp.]|nr:hypothetical protein [Baekduia sp.]